MINLCIVPGYPFDHIIGNISDGIRTRDQATYNVTSCSCNFWCNDQIFQRKIFIF